LPFHGCIPAVTTPFTPADEIDGAALKDNVDHLIAHGVTGLVATGTMGEAGSLSPAERRAVVEAVVQAAGGRVPVIVGVSAGATAPAVDNATVARECGAAGVMCLPPLNYRGEPQEIAAFYAAVADAGLPVMAYNNPAASGVDLTPGVIAGIAGQVPGIVAVKECSEDARRIAALVNDTDLEILVGGDDWALEGFAAGAVGWVSGVANVAPAECVELQALVEAGRLAEARTLYARLLPLARLDMSPLLVQFFKRAMDQVGLVGGPSRPPRMPLSPEQQAVADAAVAALRAPVAA
jgi:1-pyrroline-4-hydroxy-2-carboxylate deaminase